MNNVILITCKFSENLCLSEERILDIFISSNKEQFSIDKLYIKYHNTSNFFKRYPIMYINGLIIDANNIVKLIYVLLYNPSDEYMKHFEYLLQFLNNEFRYNYKDKFNESKSNNIPHLKREIDLLSTLNTFISFYKDKTEKDFIYTLISCYIKEYKSLFNKGTEEIMHFNCDIKEDDYLNKDNVDQFKLKEMDQEEFKSKCIPFSMKLTNKEDEEIKVSIEEIEANNNWKNNIFSLGLFCGVTGLLYILSLRTSK